MKRASILSVTTAMVATAINAADVYIWTTQTQTLPTPACDAVTPHTVATTNFLTLEGEAAEVSSCVTAASAVLTLATGTAAQCVDTTDPTAPSLTPGPDKLCPLSTLSPCTTDQYCAATDPFKCPEFKLCDEPAPLVAYKLTGTLPASCTNANLTPVELTTVYMTKYVALDGAKSAADACVTAAGATLVAEPAANACFTAQFAPSQGGAIACPLPWENTCVPAQFCQGSSNTVSTPCPEDLKCPANKLDVTHVLKTEQSLGYHYTEADQHPLPDGWAAHLAEAYVTAAADKPEDFAKCQPTTAPATTYPSNKKGDALITITPIVGDCNTTWWSGVFTNAKKIWNDNAENKDNKYELADPKLSLFAVDKYSACVDGNELKCISQLETCKDIKCADGIACSKNDECGSGTCAKLEDAETGTCTSTAFASVIAPILAAALALAFF